MENRFIVTHKKFDWDFNKKMNIYFWGDVHRDARACDVDRYKWFLKKAKEDPDAYYFGLGDYHDFASAKEQKVLTQSGLHDQTIDLFDAIVEKRNRAFAMEAGQMRGKLLGLIGGNHSWTLKNGKLADEDLAERLGTEYLGWLCVYAMTFHLAQGSSRTVYIVGCHGKAGGKLAGTSISQVDDLKKVFPFADIFVMGHDHQRGAWPTTTLSPVHGNYSFRMKEHRQYLVRSGSFLKSYEPGESQYTTSRLLRPADLGVVKMSISFHRDRKHDEIVTDIESTV